MARTPLFHRLQRLVQRALRSTDPMAADAPPIAGPSRRRFLETLGALATIPVLGPSLLGAGAAGCGDEAGGRTVAIVGAGVAGLTAAHFLELAGVTATVYEASMRTGGRMFTEQMGLQGGQLAERGGELVDSNHVVIPALCMTYGLELDDLVAATAGLAQDQFHFHGAFLSEAELVSGFTPIAAKMQTGIMAGASDTAEFARIDGLSIPQYLEQECGLAAGSVMRDLLETAYLEEFGLEVASQSAWNLVTLIDSATPDPFRVFGDSDEQFHIHTGSESLPAAMATRLAAQIELDHTLSAVAATGDRFTVSFATAGGPVDVVADHVVYSLPFTKLREVDLDAAKLSTAKHAVIDSLGYGTNAKLMMQFSERHWETAHQASGSLITDIGELQATWATSRGQPGPQGLLTNFVGGARGVAIGEGTAEAQAAMVLPWLDTAYPGTAATYLPGTAIRQHWPTYEFTKGSYACYLVGQWALAGTEGSREGNQHFCGEHTSEDFQGYMEGAAASGARVAVEILRDLGLELPASLAALVDVIGLPAARVGAAVGSGVGAGVGSDVGNDNPLARRRARMLRRAAALGR